MVGSTEAIMDSERQSSLRPRNLPWNKGRLTGQKRPLKPKDVWAIRVRLQLEHRARDIALFNLAIDSKLGGCDLVRLQVDDVCASVISNWTGRPVFFWITVARSRTRPPLGGTRPRSAPRESSRPVFRQSVRWRQG